MTARFQAGALCPQWRAFQCFGSPAHSEPGWWSCVLEVISWGPRRWPYVAQVAEQESGRGPCCEHMQFLHTHVQ